MMMKFICTFIFMCTPIISLASSPRDIIESPERRKQIFYDLCTLSIYLSGHYNHVKGHTWTALEEMMNYEQDMNEKSQTFYSHLDYGEHYAKYKIGHNYIEAIENMMDRIISNKQVSVFRIQPCLPERIQNPAALQEVIHKPVFEKVMSQLKEEEIKISIKNGLIEDQSTALLNLYIKKSGVEMHDFWYDLSLKGNELVDRYIENGVTFNSSPENKIYLDWDRQDLNFTDLLHNLTKAKRIFKNPYYWYLDYITGITIPKSLNFLKLYVRSPIFYIEKIYKKSIEHIRTGDFSIWWKNKGKEYMEKLFKS